MSHYENIKLKKLCSSIAASSFSQRFRLIKMVTFEFVRLFKYFIKRLIQKNNLFVNRLRWKSHLFLSRTSLVVFYVADALKSIGL